MAIQYQATDIEQQIILTEKHNCHSERLETKKMKMTASVIFKNEHLTYYAW